MQHWWISKSDLLILETQAISAVSSHLPLHHGAFELVAAVLDLALKHVALFLCSECHCPTDRTFRSVRKTSEKQSSETRHFPNAFHPLEFAHLHRVSILLAQRLIDALLRFGSSI
jgi:hypothetical protein